MGVYEVSDRPSGNWVFPAFFAFCCLLCTFSGGPSLIHQISSDCLSPHLLNPNVQDGPGTGNRKRRNRFFQEPKRELEPSEPFFKNRNQNQNHPFLLKQFWSRKKTVPERNCQNQKPEPFEPSHPRTVTEPNRGHPEFAALLFRNVFELFWAFGIPVPEGGGGSQTNSTRKHCTCNNKWTHVQEARGLKSSLKNGLTSGNQN